MKNEIFLTCSVTSYTYIMYIYFNQFLCIFLYIVQKMNIYTAEHMYVSIYMLELYLLSSIIHHGIVVN
jgi:hypothetical protein